MPVDVKKMIAEAARTLLVEKKVKKLTVKDIVEECHITRQSFYYHFEDIPGLLKWILEQGAEHILREARSQKTAEEALRYFLLVAVQTRPYIQKALQSNYGEEVEQLFSRQIYQMFAQIVEEAHLYPDCSQSELKLILRYHSEAVIGILHAWTEEDTKNLDQIVHTIYLLITGGISPFSKSKD